MGKISSYKRDVATKKDKLYHPYPTLNTSSGSQIRYPDCLIFFTFLLIFFIRYCSFRLSVNTLILESHVILYVFSLA
jgi:hypothetical protein